MSHQVQTTELRLIRASLLHDELLLFADGAEQWKALAECGEDYDCRDLAVSASPAPSTECRFEVKVLNAPMWLEIMFPQAYPSGADASVSLKVSDVDRREQEKWQAIIKDLMVEIRKDGGEFPILDLLSIVLPQIHDFREKYNAAKLVHQEASSVTRISVVDSTVHHALFTSHHLVSSEKRRSMQKWASELSLRGFAKVGYPGVVYCEGSKSDVEEFVRNVKTMQWLALRLRFIEPLPVHPSDQDEREGEISKSSKSSWVELEKIGDVLEYMRSRDREEFVLDVGLGSAGADAKP